MLNNSEILVVGPFVRKRFLFFFFLFTLLGLILLYNWLQFQYFFFSSAFRLASLVLFVLHFSWIGMDLAVRFFFSLSVVVAVASVLSLCCSRNITKACQMGLTIVFILSRVYAQLYIHTNFVCAFFFFARPQKPYITFLNSVQFVSFHICTSNPFHLFIIFFFGYCSLSNLLFFVQYPVLNMSGI